MYGSNDRKKYNYKGKIDTNSSTPEELYNLLKQHSIKD